MYGIVLRNSLFESLPSCPVKANLVTVWIIEICMLPTPRHHFWHLRKLYSFVDESLTDSIEVSRFKVQNYILFVTTHRSSFSMIFVKGYWCPSLWALKSSIFFRIFFDKSEMKKVLVKSYRPFDILHVYYDMIKLDVILGRMLIKTSDCFFKSQTHKFLPSRTIEFFI